MGEKPKEQAANQQATEAQGGGLSIIFSELIELLCARDQNACPVCVVDDVRDPLSERARRASSIGVVEAARSC